MKRITSLCSILLLAQLSGVCLARDESCINLQFPGGGHNNIPMPAALPDGEYGITIDAPTGNTFEGFFSTY